MPATGGDATLPDVKEAELAATGRSVQHHRGRLVLAVTLFAATILVVAFATRPSHRDGSGRSVGAAVADLPPAEVVTASTLQPLPLPEALPADPYEPTPPGVLGTIEIPKIELTAGIQRGMALTAIDRGPSWWPGTAMPGQLGNVVLAGHRTTHSRPFYALDELTPGDEVIFTTDAGRFVYEVRGVIVVPADWIDIAAQSRAHTATLFACHPLGSATERIVVKLRLLDGNGRSVDPETALPAIDAEARRTDHTLLVQPSPDGAPPAGADPFASSGS